MHYEIWCTVKFCGYGSWDIEFLPLRWLHNLNNYAVCVKIYGKFQIILLEDVSGPLTGANENVLIADFN